MRRARRFFELIAIAVALHGMVTATPVGEVLARAARRVAGLPPKPRSLLAFYARQSQAPRIEAARLEAPVPELVTENVPATELSPSLVRALAGSARLGRGTDHVLAPTRPALLAMVAAGVPWDESARGETAELLRLAEAVADLAGRLGGEEAAVAALFVPMPTVQAAIVRGLELGHPAPHRYATLRSHLSPADRRTGDAWVEGVFALRTAFELRSPVDGAPRVSSGFGVREHPVLKRKKLHTGVDLAVPLDTPLLAAHAGRVILATEDSVNGKFLRIDHGFGLTTAYCHANELGVAEGAAVAKGQVVARSGNTGRSTGPHLHFQVELGGHPVDPEVFLRLR